MSEDNIGPLIPNEDNKENESKINSFIHNKKFWIVIGIIIITLIVIIITIIILILLFENKDFYILEINDEIFKRIEGKSFSKDCTLSRGDLRYIHVLHIDNTGMTHEGEMICNKYIAETLIKIFKKLYKEKYPIEKMKLIDEYDANDEKSMEDNNSSCFNFRFISHTTRISKHGYALAVDINTLYNPYIKVVDGETIIEPITGKPYVDRSQTFIYKIEKNDLCYQLFIENGFEWGGDWEDRKDYQHFELPDSKVIEIYPEFKK